MLIHGGVVFGHFLVGAESVLTVHRLLQSGAAHGQGKFGVKIAAMCVEDEVDEARNDSVKGPPFEVLRIPDSAELEHRAECLSFRFAPGIEEAQNGLLLPLLQSEGLEPLMPGRRKEHALCDANFGRVLVRGGRGLELVGGHAGLSHGAVW